MTSTLSPAERRREKVRASILEAAEVVFAEEGESGLSIRRLAEAIDYSPAAIYKYFDSKEELIDELKEAFFAQVLAEADKLIDFEGSFDERARLCLRSYMLTAANKSHHYAAAFSGTIELSTDTKNDVLSETKARAFMILFDLVQEGQALKKFRTDIDPVSAATSLWASCHGLASLMAHLPQFPNILTDETSLSREAFIDLHADQIVRGLEVRADFSDASKP